VVGVEDEQHVERALSTGIGLYFGSTILNIMFRKLPA
jgi:hypothetical protein